MTRGVPVGALRNVGAGGPGERVSYGQSRYKLRAKFTVLPYRGLSRDLIGCGMRGRVQDQGHDLLRTACDKFFFLEDVFLHNFAHLGSMWMLAGSFMNISYV